jgi:hypothetical protein
MVNLFDTPIAYDVPTPALTILIAFTNTPRSTLGSLGIKCRCTNAFSHVIKTTNKNIKQIIEAMDQINLR